MTIEEARSSIGKPFKWSLSANWDVIKEATDDGYIIGEFLEAPVDECRLKQPQPEQLKKKNNEQEKIS